MCRFSFIGERLFNQDSHLELVPYTRHFRGVREMVLVYSERKALAYRTRDRLDVESPWDVAENAIEWRLHGDVVTVVNALLSLPTPGPLPNPQLPHKIPAGRRSSCPAPRPAPGGPAGPKGHPMSPRGSVPPLISADAAARALRDVFLVNADRGDNAANDELVAELVRRIRTQQGSRDCGG